VPTTPFPPNKKTGFRGIKEKLHFSKYANIASPYCADRAWVSGSAGVFMTVADEGPRPDGVEAVEVILDIGAEGGALTIEGSRTANGWRFRAIRNEYALFDLLNEEDREGLEFWHQSDWVQSFEAALALLDQYPWHKLDPRQVHPDFKARIWAAVQERYRTDGRSGPDRLDRWHRLCRGEGERVVRVGMD
jgi:hypothetical protein